MQGLESDGYCTAHLFEALGGGGEQLLGRHPVYTRVLHPRLRVNGLGLRVEDLGLRI